MRSPRCATPSTIRFVRPPVLDDVGDRRGPPLVYATLGTIFNMECGDLLARLVDSMNAVSDTNEIDVVITTGPGIDSANLPGSRPRLRVEEFVPHRELLGRCRAVVSHAGSGTLAAALSLGIPVVNLPMGADQPDNADRCEELGVGITLDPLTATTAEIVESTQAALHDPALRAAVAMLASEAASQPVLDAVPELRRLLITDAG
jgi:MGT family glycosyltransferase